MSLFRFEELGWKAFQDLCGTIGREVLGQTLQVFSEGRDGGRDGAYEGIWNASPLVGGITTGPTVLQCKHFKSASSKLTLASFSTELSKISALVAAGRCENYILMTNGKMSASADRAIYSSVISAGARSCVILGSEWIESIIKENQRLRMLVPRVYGLGDLTQIINAQAYNQAAALLESLKYDLKTFVPTVSYRQAAKRLTEYGLVLLLGEPAAGKSVIASTLALGSADQWKCFTIKADSAKEFTEQWNPEEPNQFFWIDDAFGATQFQEDLANQWNAILPKMKAARDKGAKIVITSRDYIWQSARPHLKLYNWPELESGQVVVNVEEITSSEREAILYNHMSLGRQPRTFKSAIKPLLPGVVAHSRFQPELARRLADPAFTDGLEISKESLANFIGNPEEFLLDIVSRLDKPSRAALTLLVMAVDGLPSPLDLDGNQLNALRMLGADEASVRSAFAVMDGSFVKLDIASDGIRTWLPRHPTIIDAMTSLMRNQTELLGIYLRMAKPSRMIREIYCGIPRQNSIGVPPSLFSLVIERLAEFTPPGAHLTGQPLVAFLAYRCDDGFLSKYFEGHRHLIDLLLEPWLPLSESDEIVLLSKLNDLALVSDDQLDQLGEFMKRMALEVADASLETSSLLRNLLGTQRIRLILTAVHSELPSQIAYIFNNWNQQYDSNLDPTDYLSPLRDALTAYGFPNEFDEFDDLLAELEYLRSESERDGYREDDDEDDVWMDISVPETVSERSIFDDIDQ